MNERSSESAVAARQGDAPGSVWSAASNPWWEAMRAGDLADSEALPTPPRGFWRRLIVWFTEYNRY